MEHLAAVGVHHTAASVRGELESGGQIDHVEDRRESTGEISQLTERL